MSTGPYIFFSRRWGAPLGRPAARRQKEGGVLLYRQSLLLCCTHSAHLVLLARHTPRTTRTRARSNLARRSFIDQILRKFLCTLSCGVREKFSDLASRLIPIPFLEALATRRCCCCWSRFPLIAIAASRSSRGGFGRCGTDAAANRCSAVRESPMFGVVAHDCDDPLTLAYLGSSERRPGTYDTTRAIAATLKLDNAA